MGAHDRTRPTTGVTELGEDAKATIVEHRVSPTAVTEVSEQMASSFQRRADRHRYGAEVTLFGLGRSVVGAVRDISISGMFVETAGLLPQHTNVGFELPLPGGASEPMRGRVVRIQDESDRHPAGLGIAFIKVDARLRSALVGLVKHLAECEGE